MNKVSADSIELAERRVAQAKAQVLAEYRALEGKVRRRATSPLFIGGVLLSAIAVAYLAIGRAGKPKAVAKATPGGLWSQLLQGAQLLLPLAGAVKAAREAKAVRKTVSRTTGTPSAKPGEK